jgi:AAA15 family ATPase/GTPase
MIIQFIIRNFKTFKDEAKLTFVASNYDKERQSDNLFEIPQFNLKLLKSAVIYGANASGKSKLIEAIDFMKKLVLNSSKESQINEPINVEPFKLNSIAENLPSFFEIIFILKNEMYRYGFEANKQKIVSEWLYYRPKTKEIELFYREGQKFEIHEQKFKVKDLIENERIRPNALLLSVAAFWNNKVAKIILEYFDEKLNVISGLKEQNYIGFSIHKLQDINSKTQIIDLMKNADFGIDDLTPKILDIQKLPSDLPKEIRELIESKVNNKNVVLFDDVLTSHKKFNNNNQIVDSISFSMDNEESSGTRKYFALTGPILETLKNGEVLFIDELDAKLHPNLICKIIEIFNSKHTNPLNGQLIFNTHDTNLLSSNLFRRDQIWFTEKNRYGAASLYSLSDFKTDIVRKEDNFEKNYINGKYGAIPFLGNFEKLFISKSDDL